MGHTCIIHCPLMCKTAILTAPPPSRRVGLTVERGATQTAIRHRRGYRSDQRMSLALWSSRPRAEVCECVSVSAYTCVLIEIE